MRTRRCSAASSSRRPPTTPPRSPYAASPTGFAPGRCVELLDRLDESRSDLTDVLSLERDERTLNDLRYLDYLQNARRGEARPPARIYVMLAETLQEVGLDDVRRGLPEAVLIRPPRRAGRLRRRRSCGKSTTRTRRRPTESRSVSGASAFKWTVWSRQTPGVHARGISSGLAREPSGARAN